jgi:hypothetical protein
MRYDDKGGEVRRIQTRLIDRGYELPRFGADGHLGEETWEALQRFAEDQNLPWKPEIPIQTLSILDRAISTAPSAALSTTSTTLDGAVRLFDLTPEQDNPSPKSKVVAGKTVLRAPSAVNGIVLHQTACSFGVTARAIAAADGDEQLARARRALRMPYHAIAFRKGFVANANELRRYTYHANRLNGPTLGLAIEGLYSGLVDDPNTAPDEADRSTWGGDPQDVTEDVLRAGRFGLRFLVEEGRAIGMPIEFLYAHRQSNDKRRSDPGEELWRRLAIEYGVGVLGLTLRQDFTVGRGRPVPVNWDPAGVGTY